MNGNPPRAIDHTAAVNGSEHIRHPAPGQVPLVRARSLYRWGAIQYACVAAFGSVTLALISDDALAFVLGFLVVTLLFGGLFSAVVLLTRFGGAGRSVVASAPAAASIEPAGQTFLRLSPASALLLALVIVFGLVPGDSGDSLVAGLPAAAALTFAVMAMDASRWERRHRARLLLIPVHQWRTAQYVASPEPD